MKPVRSVQRAINILFMITRSDKPLGLSEISRATEIDKATVLRLLSTLEASRLVQRDPTTRKYGPGSGIWRLSTSFRSDLRTIAEPILESLRQATEESVSLVCRSGMERIVVFALSAPHELRVVPSMNRVLPIYAGASGKVIMAHLPEEECIHIIETTSLKPVNAKSVTDRGVFLGLLKEAREKGYAYALGDVTLGANAIAAPVFDDEGICAAVSLRGPEVRMPFERIEQLAPLVMQSAKMISDELAREPVTSQTA